MFTKFLHPLLILVLALLSWLPAPASAQSGCTAMWGVVDNDGGGAGANFSMRYYNSSTNRWVTVTSANISISANAMGGDSTTGMLYYLERDANPAVLHSFNLNTNVDTVVGNVAAPPAPASGINTLGATFDNSGRFFVYATSGVVSTGSFAVVAQISLTTGNTLTSWTQVRTTAGLTPTISNSGDMYVDKSGVAYILTNTNPPQRHQIDLDPASASFGRTVSPSQVITGASGVTPWGISQDPVTGNVYFGTNNGGSATYILSAGGAATLLDNSAYTLGDTGNCVATPAVPSVTKSFSPTFASASPGTSTVYLTFNNTNIVPFWLTRDFRDLLPTTPGNMRIHNVPSLQGTCITSVNVITAVPGGTSLTFAAGGRIPAGGCTLQFNVSTTVAGEYNNTIPIGSLTTTAGSNAVGVTATFYRGVSDFSVTKAQRAGTSGAFTTATTTIGSGMTLQYQLTIVNSLSAGTGSVTFTDTLPQLITPMLSITAAQSGGGTCTTVSAVVTGRTQIRGTITAAAPGSTCTITITARGSPTLAASATAVNTVTVAAVGSVPDGDTSNNGATVTTPILLAANLQVAKTNNVTQVFFGQTTSYTVTISNLGPNSAPGAVLLDPPATGLNCTTVTFASTPIGSITVTPTPLTLTALQTTGISLTPFPSGSTATFNVSCGITATGL